MNEFAHLFAMGAVFGSGALTLCLSLLFAIRRRAGSKRDSGKPSTEELEQRKVGYRVREQFALSANGSMDSWFHPERWNERTGEWQEIGFFEKSLSMALQRISEHSATRITAVASRIHSVEPSP